MNLQQLMKQAQQMQEKLQKQMEATVVDATAGGGMVAVKMNGQKQLLSIQIDPEVFTSGDKDMLQDLIVAAVNEGIRKVDEALAGQLGGLTGGLKIPGLFAEGRSKNRLTASSNNSKSYPVSAQNLLSGSRSLF